MPAVVAEYKGHPTISLTKDAQDKYPFSFGLAKAQMILENIEAIKAFVAANTEPTKN